MKKLRKAVFPVGGFGTRFLPATKAMPKEMLTVVDKPLIHYAVEEARAAGIEQFIFVTGRGKTSIEDYFDEHYEFQALLESRGKKDVWIDIQNSLPDVGQISYTRQPEPLGLGHAVWCAKNLVGDEPFAVLLADDLLMSQKPCLKQMIDAYEQFGGNVVALMEVAQDQLSNYGIVATDGQTAAGPCVPIKGMVEKPDAAAAPSRLAVLGRYILQPEIFENLEKGQRGAGGEIQLTDALSTLIGQQPFHGLRFNGQRFDCGSKVGFLEANLAFALSRDDMAADVHAMLNRRFKQVA